MKPLCYDTLRCVSWLVKTHVEGPLPNQIGNLERLTSLIIRSNPLGGEIPEGIGRLVNLEECFLNGNGLNGTLSPAFGGLPNLSFVDLSNNTLNGVLPSELGSLHKLVQFQGQMNGFTGEIPAQLFSLPLLKSLYLHSNKLERFPQKVEASQSLQSLRLQVNALAGPLPNDFGNFVELTSLLLQNNGLTSTLPSDFAQLVKLKRLEIHNNAFSGRVPDLQGMESLTSMKAQQNLFTGPFPRLPLSIQRLDFSENRLHGGLATVSQLQQVVELRIALNQFTGDLNMLETLPKLRTFDAHHNFFNGSFPVLSGSARTIDLNNNKLSGGLNTDMFSGLKRLNTLSIGNNKLTSLDNFVLPLSIRKLELQDNEFEGSIPKEIFDLARLTVLDLSGNDWDPTSLTPNITRLAALRRLSVGVDVVCDCNLLSWYTPFVNEASRIDNKAEIARCSEVNSFAGTHPHLLTVDEHAPCTHATLVSVTSSARSLNLTWSFDDIRLNSYLSRDKSILDILGPADRALFTAGAHVNSANDGLDGAFAFELEWSDSTSSSGFSRRFVDAKLSRLSTSNFDANLFAEDLQELLPNSAYNLRIRPLRVLQQGTLPVAYVYGPSSSLLTQTREDLPSGGVVNLRAVDLEATRIQLTWDVPEETQLNGRIVQYKLEVWDERLIRRLESESDTATIVNLKPERQYSVRVQPGTIRGFSGEWSKDTNVTTCPPLSRWSNETSLSLECEAIEGHYRDERNQFKSCAELTRDFSDALQNECTQVGVSVRSLPLGRGYWRASLETSSFHPCPNPLWCKGSANGLVSSVDDYCVDNHTGVFCFSCVKGSVQSPQGCIVCTSEDEIEANTTVALYSLLYLLILGFYVGKMLLYSRVLRECCSRRKRGRRQRRQRSSRNGILKSAASSFTRLSISSVKESVRNYNTAKVRIFFGFLQVYFAFRRNFPASNRNNNAGLVTLDFLSSSSFALVLDSFAVRCGFDLTPYSILLLTTLLPVVFILILVALRNVLMHRFAPLATLIKREFTWSVLSFLFLIYPSVSRTVLETFWCTQVAGMEHPVLKIDYQATCDATSERIAWVVYAAFMVIVYPVGVVMLYAALLHYYVELIHKRKEEQSEEDVQRLAKISFLVSPYQDSAYWFETYELLRKLLQTSLIGFLLPWVPPENLNVVAVVSQNLCIVAIGVLLYTQPYRHKSDFVFALLSLALLLLDTQFSVVDPYEPADSAFTLYTEIAVFVAFSSVDVLTTFRHDDSCFASERESSKRIQMDGDNKEEEQVVRVEVPSDQMQSTTSMEAGRSPSSIATSQSSRTQQEEKTIEVNLDDSISLKSPDHLAKD